VIEGLDYKTFQELDVEERVKLIPRAFFEKIELKDEKEILVYSHPHPLKNR
jgi:hypothetical protein